MLSMLSLNILLFFVIFLTTTQTTSAVHPKNQQIVRGPRRAQHWRLPFSTSVFIFPFLYLLILIFLAAEQCWRSGKVVFVVVPNLFFSFLFSVFSFSLAVAQCWCHGIVVSVVVHTESHLLSSTRTDYAHLLSSPWHNVGATEKLSLLSFTLNHTSPFSLPNPIPNLINHEAQHPCQHQRLYHAKPSPFSSNLLAQRGDSGYTWEVQQYKHHKGICRYWCERR